MEIPGDFRYGLKNNWREWKRCLDAPMGLYHLKCSILWNPFYLLRCFSFLCAHVSWHFLCTQGEAPLDAWSMRSLRWKLATPCSLHIPLCGKTKPWESPANSNIMLSSQRSFLNKRTELWQGKVKTVWKSKDVQVGDLRGWKCSCRVSDISPRTQQFRALSADNFSPWHSLVKKQVKWAHPEVLVMGEEKGRKVLHLCCSRETCHVTAPVCVTWSAPTLWWQPLCPACRANTTPPHIPSTSMPDLPLCYLLQRQKLQRTHPKVAASLRKRLRSSSENPLYFYNHSGRVEFWLELWLFHRSLLGWVTAHGKNFCINETALP